jgi:hypothetical protein
VAIGILFIALLALARTATVAFTDVAAARQRQTGAQLANRLLEEVRGLPYDTVLNGLDDADLGGDANIAVCGTDYYYPACPPDPDAEEIVHTPGLPDPTTPLVPHRGTVGPPDFPSNFRWWVYVTEAADAPEAGALRITVRVAWSDAIREGVRNFVEAQTLVYSPEGCVDSATHPFSAPCQPYFYGNGSAGAGTVDTTGTVEGFSFDSVGIDMLGQSADAQMEQITNVEGAVNLPRAVTVVGGVETSTTPESVSTAGDDDPSTSVGIYSRETVGPQAPGNVAVSGTGDELAVVIDGSTTGTTTSTTEANITNTCNVQVDDLPCGHSTSRQAGAITETLGLTGSVGTSNLVSVGVAGSDSSSYVRRSIPGGEEIGSVQQTVEWVLPEIRIGGLPSGMQATPANWEGYWVRLSGFTATATAQAGQGTTAPSVTITGGQVRYWNGSGYTNQAVTSAGGDISIAPLDHSSGTGDGNTVRVEIAGSVSVQPSDTSETLDGTDRLQGKGVIGTPLIVDMAYRVSRNGTQVADLLVEFDAGSARASALYKPSAAA